MHVRKQQECTRKCTTPAQLGKFRAQATTSQRGGPAVARTDQGGRTQGIWNQGCPSLSRASGCRPCPRRTRVPAAGVQSGTSPGGCNAHTQRGIMQSFEGSKNRCISQCSRRCRGVDHSVNSKGSKSTYYIFQMFEETLQGMNCRLRICCAKPNVLVSVMHGWRLEVCISFHKEVRKNK